MGFKKDTTDWGVRSKSYNDLQWVKSSKIDSELIRIVGNIANKNCIDIGCGPGKLSNMLFRENGAENFCCLDSSAEMLSLIENREFTKILSRIEDVEGYDNYFDVAVAKMVFHHIPDINFALSKIYSILKEQGSIFICEGHPPNRHCVDFYTEMFSYKEVRHTLTIDDIIFALHQTGFSHLRSHSLVLNNMSLSNWLENSGIKSQNQKIIYDLHKNAPEHVKESYAMQESHGDILMNWHFSIIVGEKVVVKG